MGFSDNQRGMSSIYKASASLRGPRRCGIVLKLLFTGTLERPETFHA